jgi:hypothetical protein
MCVSGTFLLIELSQFLVNREKYVAIPLLVMRHRLRALLCYVQYVLERQKYLNVTLL